MQRNEQRFRFLFVPALTSSFRVRLDSTSSQRVLKTELRALRLLSVRTEPDPNKKDSVVKHATVFIPGGKEGLLLLSVTPEPSDALFVNAGAPVEFPEHRIAGDVLQPIDVRTRAQAHDEDTSTALYE